MSRVRCPVPSRPAARSSTPTAPTRLASPYPIVTSCSPSTTGPPLDAEILDVLQRRGVPATFFVVGARAADRPDLVRRMYDGGSRGRGAHLHPHEPRQRVAPGGSGLELDQTQLAIAAATGHATSLLRPPYSSQADAVEPSEWQAVASARGYRVVYADLDTRDWARPGVDAIVAAGTPRATGAR